MVAAAAAVVAVDYDFVAVDVVPAAAFAVAEHAESRWKQNLNSPLSVDNSEWKNTRTDKRKQWFCYVIGYKKQINPPL